MPGKLPAFYRRRAPQLLAAQLVLLYLPCLRLFSLSTDNGPIPAGLCYFFSLVFAPCLLLRRKSLRLPPPWLGGFFLYTVVLAALRAGRYGLSKSILHWLFGCYLLLAVLELGAGLTREQWLRVLGGAACVFAVLHAGYLLLFERGTVLWLLRGYFNGTATAWQGDRLGSLTRGGRNLDATWLALGIFFVQGRRKAFYIAYAVLFAFLGGSRAGAVAAGLAVLWTALYDPYCRLTRRTARRWALGAAAMLAVLLGSGMLQAMLGKFLVPMPAPARWIGPAAAARRRAGLPAARLGGHFLSGRGAMWAYVPALLRAQPWGYGAGNALRVLRARYGYTGGQDILHNVFLQLLVDEGIPGGVWYLCMAGAHLRGLRARARRRDPFAGYFSAYLLLSLVQFHGAEALMLFVLGAWLSCRANGG